MKNSTRKTSRHKRYHADPTAFARTLAACSDQCQKHATGIAVKVLTAFERLKSGVGTDADFDRVASAINVALVRAEAIHVSAVEVMKAGIEAMIECDSLRKDSGKYGFTGDGLTAATDALNLYEDILRLSSPMQMETAVAEVQKRMFKQLKQ